MSRRNRHPDWCQRRQGCGLGEHRARPIVMPLPGGTAVLTRVQGTGGTEHAEVRLSLTLPTDRLAARRRLIALLRQLGDLAAPKETQP